MKLRLLKKAIKFDLDIWIVYILKIFEYNYNDCSIQIYSLSIVFYYLYSEHT